MEKTINDVFRNRVIRYKERIAVEKKRNGVWESVSWNNYYDKARFAGLGFYSLGAGKGDRISLLSENRLEWLYTDLGTLGIGAVVVPIYTTLTTDETVYIVDNSGSKILVVEDGFQLDKALEVKKKCPCLEKIVVMNEEDAGEKHPYIISFRELLESGEKVHRKEGSLFEKLAGDVTPDDLATIVYTSGTTGFPKGAMITHKNIMAVILSLDRIKPGFADESDNTVPFLPLSHVFERAAGHFYGMYVGITASYAESIDTLLQDFREKRPTMILAVPRVCEKVYQKIIAKVQEQPAWKQKVFYWGHGIGMKISELREKKASVPALMKIKYKIAYFMIFKNLQEALGGRVRWMAASGAPTAREIILFFNAAGITVVEGYGMTECFAPATMSNLSDYKIGTVGRPLPGLDIKTAEDGEILIKGDNVFDGYWKMEDETKNSFTEDGYLKSGDIGMFDEDGFLTITDRKKNLIITSGGKNIAPQKIENLFMGDPLFSHFILIGERKKFLSALVTINPEQAQRIASEKKIPFKKPEEIFENEIFLAEVEKHVAEKNTNLAKFETIKKFKIIRNQFSQETGELTPSLKLKRKVVFEKYKNLIDSMYE